MGTLLSAPTQPQVADSGILDNQRSGAHLLSGLLLRLILLRHLERSPALGMLLLFIMRRSVVAAACAEQLIVLYKIPEPPPLLELINIMYIV